MVSVALNCNWISSAIMNNKIPDFEDVWGEILEIARRKASIKTLGMCVENEIISVESDRIMVVSERTGKERPVRKEDVKMDWEILANKGLLQKGEEKSWHGSIVAAFLAELPFVDYTLRPRTLYLKSH